MENAEVISVNSSPPVTLSSASDGAVLVRCIYKEDNRTVAPTKMEKRFEKPSSSSSSERVPVSWSSKKYNIQKLANKTPSPSPTTKVANWLNKKGNWTQASIVTAPPRFVTECKKKSAILARHDFNKSFTITECKTQDISPISTCTSVPSDAETLERHKVFNIKTNCSEQKQNSQGVFEIENTVPIANKATHSLISANSSANFNIFVKNSIKVEEVPEVAIRQEGAAGIFIPKAKLEETRSVVCDKGRKDTPLSPESQKKRELCSYLRLVNLSARNHKEIAPIQNRRSVRVKNNLLLTEKKELERKLNGETSKGSPSEEVLSDDASQKSFKELFGENNPLEHKKKEDVTVSCIPKEFLEKQEDFDDFAREFFNTEKMKMPKRKKPKRLVSKWETQNTNENLKKRNIREQINKIFKKPIKKNGVYKLRKKKFYKENNGLKVQRKYKNSGKSSLKNLLTGKVKRSLRSTENMRSLVMKNIVGEGSASKKKSLKKMRKKKLAEENNFVNVVLQDHNYICSDVVVVEHCRNGEMECCSKSSSASSPCYGFSSPERNSTSYEELNKLCLRLSEYIEDKQKAVEDTAMTHKADVVDPNLISPKTCEYIALDPEIKPKSLHRTLVQQRIRKRRLYNTDYETDDSPNWDTDESPSTSRPNRNDKRYNLSHSICVSKDAGAVIKAFYVNFNLIIVQESEVIFWNQSALGNILGAHNMWLQKGQVSRILLDNGCLQKESREMVISLENSVAYVELWTKEHKSDKREIPVADVFAAIYFCRNRQNGVFKKVLQLENIKSSAEDVRYIVMQNSRNIIVCWRMVRGDEKRTIVHCYHLAADFQAVDVIKEIESVQHCVSSLHSIEGCDDLIIGWGENKATLWNLEYGYVIATVEILETMPLSSPFSVKCDRGFLFLLQQMENGNVCLIAINGLNQSWKRLQTFVPPQHFENVTGVYLENGLLVVFFRNGVLAWHINSGELRVEEESLNCDLCILSGKHAIMFSGREVHVRHALTLLIASDDCVGTVDDR